jgi:hypothetical protein
LSLFDIVITEFDLVGWDHGETKLDIILANLGGLDEPSDN